MWPWSDHFSAGVDVYSTTQVAERPDDSRGKNIAQTAERERFPPVLFSLFVFKFCLSKGQESSVRLRLTRGAFWFNHWSTRKTIEVKSLRRCNMCPVDGANLHNQIQTLFFQQPPAPPFPSPTPLFSFKRAESIRKATWLFCHLRGCRTSISFPRTPYKIPSRPIPLAIDFIPFILPGFKNLPHTKRLVTNHF